MVQLIDIMPTILDYANINKDSLMMQGSSLVPLLSSENEDFWRNRICCSDEVMFDVDKKGVYGSLFYKDIHILTSDRLYNGLWSQGIELTTETSRSLLSRQFFLLRDDWVQYLPILSFEIDLFLQYNIFRFEKKLRETHLFNQQKNNG
ncbi:MAG: hypothetical protein R2874_00645 [Desulfobacterales bacterium]